MFSEDDLLPLSALQHLLFCPRQCALIHLEQLWAENRLTVEGQHLHRRVHEQTVERRHGVHIVRGLSLRSFRFGLVGKADVVEFMPVDDVASARAEGDRAGLDAVSQGRWQVTPVEYKRGRPKSDSSDRVQLCAQALCLEEMLDQDIPCGALFYGKRRRRTEVLFDAALRAETIAAAAQLHELIRSRRTPPAIREPKCDHCSLLTLCMPAAISRAPSLRDWNERQFREVLNSAGPALD